MVSEALPGVVSAICTKPMGGLRKSDWTSDLMRRFVGRASSSPSATSSEESATALKLHTQLWNEANCPAPDCSLISHKLYTYTADRGSGQNF